MASDLEAYTVFAVEQACRVWRTGTEPENRFFPTSGQLIGAMPKALPGRFTSRWQGETDDGVARKFPKYHLPWRDILREHGQPIPSVDSPIARALDALQPDMAPDV